MDTDTRVMTAKFNDVVERCCEFNRNHERYLDAEDVSRDESSGYDGITLDVSSYMLDDQRTRRNVRSTFTLEDGWTIYCYFTVGTSSHPDDDVRLEKLAFAEGLDIIIEYLEKGTVDGKLKA